MKSDNSIDRRSFLARAALGSLAVSTAILPAPALAAAELAKRKMKTCLSPGSIGVKASQTEAIDLAQKFGFEAVEPYADYLADLTQPQTDELLATLKQKQLAWGAAGLPVEFRRDEQALADGLQRLPKLAAGMQRAGVTRVGTWIMPGDGKLTYVQNFRQHARRLREVAKVLGDHGQQLGLEYVGTFTLRANTRFPFLHTLTETKELIGEIGTGNVGVVLDTWHWWQAGDTEADLLMLKPEEIVSVDLNDAPPGVAIREQQDGRRELPAATGVLPAAKFLKSLLEIGYAGPVRAEPFNQALNSLDNEAACAAVAAALKKAFAMAQAG